MVWNAVGGIAGWAAGTGEVQAAALMLGHLEALGHDWIVARGRKSRETALAIVNQDRDARQEMARGAAMTDDEVLEFVLDLLHRHASSAPTRLDTAGRPTTSSTSTARKNRCPDGPTIAPPADPVLAPGIH